MGHVLVSIIIPVYNCGRWLTKCLESVLSQRHENLQIIIVNDGSTDDSKSICYNYASLDSRIIVIDSSHSGVSTSRNIGLDHIEGEYVMFVDADDLLSPDIISSNINYFENEDIDIVQSKVKTITTDGKTIPYRCLDKYIYTDNSTLMADIALDQNITVSVWGKLFRRYLFDNVRFKPDLEFGEDVFLLSSISSSCRSVLISGNGTYYYRQRPGQVTQQNFSSKKHLDIAIVNCHVNTLYLALQGVKEPDRQLIWGKAFKECCDAWFYSENRTILKHLFTSLDNCRPSNMSKLKMWYKLTKIFPCHVVATIYNLTLKTRLSLIRK